MSTFEGYVDTALNQIRQNSKSSPAVLIKMMEAISVISSHLISSEQHKILRNHAEIIKNTAQNNFGKPQDLEDLQSRYEMIAQLQEAQKG